MNLKDEIRFNGIMGPNKYMINEMAAAHLVKVIKLIKAGEIEKAAQEYLDAGGVPGGVTRTVNHYIKNNPKQDNTNFEKFKDHFAQLKKTKEPEKDEEGNIKKRAYTKKTAEVGRQGQQAAKKRLENKIVQQYHINKEFVDNIKSKTDAELKAEMKDAIEDITIGKTYKEDEPLVATLKSFVEKGEGREKAIDALVELLKKGMVSIRDFGLWAEKPESFVTPKSKERAEARIKKIREKEKEAK